MKPEFNPSATRFTTRGLVFIEEAAWWLWKYRKVTKAEGRKLINCLEDVAGKNCLRFSSEEQKSAVFRNLVARKKGTIPNGRAERVARGLNNWELNAIELIMFEEAIWWKYRYLKSKEKGIPFVKVLEQIETVTEYPIKKHRMRDMIQESLMHRKAHTKGMH